jgi:hypothetical protein
MRSNGGKTSLCHNCWAQCSKCRTILATGDLCSMTTVRCFDYDLKRLKRTISPARTTNPFYQVFMERMVPPIGLLRPAVGPRATISVWEKVYPKMLTKQHQRLSAEDTPIVGVAGASPTSLGPCASRANPVLARPCPLQDEGFMQERPRLSLRRPQVGLEKSSRLTKQLEIGAARLGLVWRASQAEPGFRACWSSKPSRAVPAHSGSRAVPN